MVHTPELIKELSEKANTLRRHCVTIFEGSRSGHVGGTFSIVELVTALYFHHMRFDPRNVDWPERDRLVLSKAHACEALYAALAELEVLPKESLKTFYRRGSPLQGHADRWCTPGIDFSGGSLGEGISHAIGMAYAAAWLWKPPFEVAPPVYKKYPARFRVFCILGDGECHEGQVWEAAMSAAKYRLDNLIAIVDYNKYSIDGPSMDVMRLEPFVDKWKAFGWYVVEVDGHDLAQIVDALDLMDNLYGDGRPKLIIAHTVKGRGIPYFEERHLHGAGGRDIEKGLEQGRALYMR